MSAAEGSRSRRADLDVVAAAIDRINASWTARDPAHIEAALLGLFDPNMVIRGPKFEEMARGRVACIASYVDFVRTATVHAFSAVKPQIDVFGDVALAMYGWRIDYTLEGTRYGEEGHDLFAFRLAAAGCVALWRAMLPGDSETLE